MRWIEKLNGIVAQLETFILILLLSVMVLLGFFQVILRDFFSYGFTWTDELLRNLVLWSALMGGSLATKAGRHINIDIITRTLHGRSRAMAEVLVDSASTVVCLLLLKASLDFVQMEREFPQASMFFDMPVWAFEVIFPVFFLLSAARFLVHAMDGLSAVVTGRELKGGVVAHDFKVGG